MYLVYYPPKGLKCYSYNKIHSLVVHKHAMKLLEEFLDTKEGSNQINERTELGHTPLMLAVINNLPDAINLLLFYGANINALDCEGNSILMITVLYNTRPESDLLEFISYLVTLLADITIKNYNNKTLVDICYNRGYERVMKYVLEYNKLIYKVSNVLN